VANEDAAPEILCHHSYRKEVQLTKRSAEALARGLSEALRLILVDLEGDLRRLQLK
jgi:hypothetical protein